uniref:Ubiquitin-like domain-containing protein n=1 Tax=Astatotilapia calliptera TaxID=8154 RepID=A0AAX7SX95_ASTCA
MADEKPKESVKTENNEHINLKVAGQDGSVVQFKIKRHTPLIKLMKAYCERQGLSMRQIRFRFDGQPINETDTPAQVTSSCLSISLHIVLCMTVWKWKMKIRSMCFNNRRADGFNRPRASPLSSWTPPTFLASEAHSACFFAARLNRIPRRRSFPFLCYT